MVVGAAITTGLAGFAAGYLFAPRPAAPPANAPAAAAATEMKEEDKEEEDDGDSEGSDEEYDSDEDDEEEGEPHKMGRPLLSLLLSLTTPQVLLIRTDVGMEKGKVAAQCSHATLGAYKRPIAPHQSLLFL